MLSDLAVGSTPEIEEERRLLYVAMTRARDHLYMIIPQRFFAHPQRSNGDRHTYSVRTRFISSGITEHFEQFAWPPAEVEVGLGSNGKLNQVNIGARLKSMWR
jgi:DNA helicase II / ATP-dependent DNA helicase PcrA